MSQTTPTLFDALHTLARAHTRDDARVGFLVERCAPHLFCSDAEYIEAWRIVREQLHFQVEPNEE